MARQKLSVEGRRRRNRDYQKKQRAKIHSEAELKEEYLRKERQRWKKRVEEGKIQNINNLNEKKKRSQRKAWKRRQQVSRERKRKGLNHRKLPQTVQWIRPYMSQLGVGRLQQEKGKEKKQEQDTLER